MSNFGGSYLDRFRLDLAHFWTSDHLSGRTQSVDAFLSGVASRTPTLKRRWSILLLPWGGPRAVRRVEVVGRGLGGGLRLAAEDAPGLVLVELLVRPVERAVDLRDVAADEVDLVALRVQDLLRRVRDLDRVLQLPLDVFHARRRLRLRLQGHLRQQGVHRRLLPILPPPPTTRPTTTRPTTVLGRAAEKCVALRRLRPRGRGPPQELGRGRLDVGPAAPGRALAASHAGLHESPVRRAVLVGARVWQNAKNHQNP